MSESLRQSLRMLYVHGLLFVPFVGVMASRVAFPLYVLELGGSALDAGLISAVNHLPTVLSYNVGVVQARAGYRRLLAIGALCGGAGLLMPYFFPGLAMLYAAALFSGIWSLFVLAPTQSLVGLLSAPQDVARNYSHYNVLAWMTGFLGPLAAGYSIEGVGYRLAFVLLASGALATLLMLAFWHRVIPALPRSEGVRPSLRATLSDRRMLMVMLAASVLQIGMDMFPFFLPIYGYSLGFSPSHIGILVAVASISAVAVCLVLPKLVTRFGELPLLGGSLMLSGAGFALMPLFESFVPLLVVSLLYGLGIGGGQPLTTMLAFKRAQKGAEGAAMGLRLLFTSVTKVAAPALFGGMAAALGLPAVLLTIGGVLGLAGWRARRDSQASA